MTDITVVKSITGKGNLEIVIQCECGNKVGADIFDSVADMYPLPDCWVCEEDAWRVIAVKDVRVEAVTKQRDELATENDKLKKALKSLIVPAISRARYLRKNSLRRYQMAASAIYKSVNRARKLLGLKQIVFGGDSTTISLVEGAS